MALPHHEFGPDVIARVGALRYQQHRSVPAIHLELTGRGVVVCQRTVPDLPDRYDELLAVRLGDSKRRRGLPAKRPAGQTGAGDPGHRRAATGRGP